MNKKLQFSWAHIIAFLALIFIGYVTMMGATYISDGNFTIGIACGCLSIIVMVAFFIVPQQLKGTKRKFEARIKAERTLLALSPLAFILAMLPYLHFMTVNSHERHVVANFRSAVNGSKELFADYEAYSNGRIAAYDKMLDDVIARNKAASNGNSAYAGKEFTQCGFSADNYTTEKENMVQALKLQLKSDNYATLRDTAYAWIDRANRGATTWNVFMVGNTKEIHSAITEWQSILEKTASHVMANEEMGGNKVSAFKSTSVDNAHKSLDLLHKIYTKPSAPSLLALTTAILLFGAMILPYVVQSRNSKSTFRLLGRRQSHVPNQGQAAQAGIEPPAAQDITIDDEQKPISPNKYSSFTLD